MNTTYSFDDVGVTISHPSFGQCVANGKGIGTLTISMSTERTSQEVAADGSVMTSKIKGRNGIIALAIQQTSSVNEWLSKLFNYLEAASASEWALISVIVRSPQMKQISIASGVAIQKQADRPYQASGQLVTWSLMASDIQQDVL